MVDIPSGTSDNSMEKLKLISKKLLNFYVIVGFVALVWIAFFDRYNLVDRLQTQMHLRELRQDLAFFKAERDEIEETRNMLESDLGELERFARENYIMKRPSEDLFLIEGK